MSLHVGGGFVRYAPVSRAHRHWVAWGLAIALHLAVIGLVANWRLAPPPAERTGLDVVLVSPSPVEAPMETEAVPDIAPPAPLVGEPLTEESLAEESLAETEAPLAEESWEAPPLAEAPPVDEVPALAETPALPAREESERDPAPAPLTEPAREEAPAASREAEPQAPPAAASGRDLLARATSQIREQGLAPGSAQEGGRSAASRAAEARYIDDWTRRVEDYGNRVHPAPRHLHGQLRIRVVIGSDGGLRLAEVIQSSGHAELDQAALDTVYGAAPYRPFDRDMGERDSLSITRVWRFGQGNHYGVR